MRSTFRVLALAFVVFVLSRNPVAAQMSTVDQAKSVERLTAIANSLKEMQQQIPQHYLSPEALAEKNDYDPDQIISWVKNNIQYTPSPGYQRLPQAALRTATGNALEQAILLQSVLVQAGLEVRLSKATLDSDQTMALLRESFIASPARQWQLDPVTRDEFYTRLSRQFDGSDNLLGDRHAALENLIPWPDSAVYRDAQALALDISTAVEKEHKAAVVPANSLLQPWLSNARDYYFIKYRFGQGDAWLEAHPAFASTNPAIANSAYHTEGVEGYHHSVTLQAFITRELDGNLETIPVSGVHKSTVADLFENQLQFDTIPSGIQKALEEKSLSSLESGQFFVPSINSELATNARFFTLDGRDYSPSELSDPMAGVAIAANKKVSEVTQRLNGALDNKTEQQDSVQGSGAQNSRLLHYFLAIEWAAPNGQKRALRRTLYREQSALTPSQQFDSITQRVALAATPAPLAPAAELYSSLDAMQSAFALMATFGAEQYTDAQMLKQIGLWADQRTDLLFNGVVRLSEEAAGSARLFSQSPVIALRWEKLAGGPSSAVSDPAVSNADATTRTTFDYLINAAQVAVAAGEVIEIKASRTLEYGVWSTYGEAIAVAGAAKRDGLSADSTSAANAFNQARVDNELLVLSSARIGSVDTSIEGIIPSQLAERIASDTEHVYLLPKSANKAVATAYYRLNPTTGEALGYSLDGRGAAFSETTIANLAVISQTAAAVGKMVACTTGTSNQVERVDCVGCVVLQYAIGLIGTLTLGPGATIAAQSAADAADAGCSFL